MKLQVFNGGLNTRVAQHLVKPNEAIEYINIDSSTGALVPVNTEAATGIELAEYAYYFEADGNWIHSSTPRHYLEYQGTLYYSEVGQIPKSFDGTTERLLGIAGPTAVLTLTAEEGIDVPETVLKVVKNIAAGNLDGKYTYKLAYYDSVNTVMSIVSAQSERIGVEAEQIDLSEMPVPTDSKVTGKYLYRKGGDITQYTFVADVGIANTNYTDDISDATVIATNSYPISDPDGTYTYVYTYYNSAKGIESQPSPVSKEIDTVNATISIAGLVGSSDPQVDKIRIYRVGGDLTSFSLVSTISNGVTTYVDSVVDTDIPGDDMVATDFRQALSGTQYLVEAYGVLFGAVGDKVYYTPPGVPTAWPATYFIDFPTTITGLQPISAGVLVFTRYKTYIIAGLSHATFTKRVFSSDQGCLSAYSIQEVRNTIIWVSSDGICTVDGSRAVVLSKNMLNKIVLDTVSSAVHDEVYYALQSDSTILAYDFRFNTIVKNLSLGNSRLVVGSDTLYGYYSGTYKQLFVGITKESFTFKSAELSEGALTTRKKYKSVFIKSTGTITVEVFITGVSVIAKTFTTDDSHELKIPEEYLNGYSIQFKLTGTGDVSELEYTVSA